MDDSFISVPVLTYFDLFLPVSYVLPGFIWFYQIWKSDRMFEVDDLLYIGATESGGDL